MCDELCGVDIDCAEHDGETFGDPEDCTKYFECLDSELVHKDCSARLFFDCERKVCDFDYQATCQHVCLIE